MADPTKSSTRSLQVGLTDYKDHMGTNLSSEVDRWVGKGEHRWNLAP